MLKVALLALLLLVPSITKRVEFGLRRIKSKPRIQAIPLETLEYM